MCNTGAPKTSSWCTLVCAAQYTLSHTIRVFLFIRIRTCSAISSSHFNRFVRDGFGGVCVYACGYIIRVCACMYWIVDFGLRCCHWSDETRRINIFTAQSSQLVFERCAGTTVTVLWSSNNVWCDFHSSQPQKGKKKKLDSIWMTQQSVNQSISDLWNYKFQVKNHEQFNPNWHFIEIE